jgi:uncharacterized protein YccT (UPF0319 family)
MKKALVSLAVSLCFVSAINAATITPQKGVSLLYINGMAAGDKIGASELKEGFNQVVVRMDKDLSRGSSPAVFTSAPYVLSFKVSGEDLFIKHPQARSEMEAKKAFKTDKPDWSLEQDGHSLSYEQAKLEGKMGLFPYSGLDELVSKHNAERGIYFDNGELIDKPVETQVLAASTVAVTSASSVQSNKNTKLIVSSSNLDQLKAWYLKSSKKERKEFRKWMIDQE